MTSAALHALYFACAPLVAPSTLDAVIGVESHGNEFAVNINGPITARAVPRSLSEALEVARAGIRAGYTVDVGLMQLNSSNFVALGVTLEQLFDPCDNLRAGSRLLADAYERAVRVHGEGQRALRAALSAYNTGSLRSGIENGYVDRVSRQSRHRVPAYTPYTAGTAVINRSTAPKGEDDDRVE